MSESGLENLSDPDLELRVAGGDVKALACFFGRHRKRLTQILSLRIDKRVRGRFDPSDVVQDTFVEAVARLPGYAGETQEKRMPVFLWVRFLAVQKLLQLHRRHFRKQRDPGREISIQRNSYPEATSAVLVDALAGNLTSPSQAAVRAETKAELEKALNSMKAIDREVLVLRHFEHLSGVETALVLDLEVSTASKRYVHAIERLAKIFDRFEGDCGTLDVRPLG